MSNPTSDRQCVRSIAPATSADASIRIRDSWAGQFYTRHVKKYQIVRLVAPWLWRKLYFLYQMSWIYGKARKLPLLPLSDIASAVATTALTDRETVATPMPEVYPAAGRQHFQPASNEYIAPSCRVVTLPDGLVTGSTNLVLLKETAVCHDLYDFARDSTSEELNGRTYIWPKRSRIAWLIDTSHVSTLDQAACFTDACAKNYAHWTTEVLTRIYLFCSWPGGRHIPLIVDAGLHPNQIESLNYVAGRDREIIYLPADTTILVKRLFVTSVSGYVPFARRNQRLRDHSHGCFSPSTLRAMRDHLITQINPPSADLPRRILVKRNSEIRNVVNFPEIEQRLVSIGFAIIEPERLTVADQIATFSRAEVVVAATGAALANLIFCQPTARIVVLMSSHEHMPYWYWQNMACAVGNQVTYVIGKATERFAHLHSNFVVSPADVCDAVRNATIRHDPR